MVIPSNSVYSQSVSQTLYHNSLFLFFQPILGLFGLVGNLLSILVLSAHQMKNSFNKLLIALAIFDSVFIIFVVLDYTFIRGNIGIVLTHNHEECLVWQWPITQESSLYAYLLPKVIYPLNNISLCCSIFTTIVIAFERFENICQPVDLTVDARYTAVCNPYLYKEDNAAPKVAKRVLTFMFPVIILSVLINIPRFFETVIISETVNITTAANETVEEERVYYEITPLRMNANYIRFFSDLLLCKH